jgi:hypothetical protein
MIREKAGTVKVEFEAEKAQPGALFPDWQSLVKWVI